MGESNLSPQKQPFFYVTMLFVAGIVSDRFFQPPRWLLVLLLSLIVLAALRMVQQKKAVSATLALLISFTFIGALLSQAERLSVADNRLQKLFEAQRIMPTEAVELTGVLIVPPEPA